MKRRLLILSDTHQQIWKENPPNYAVINGLFTFLIQSVLFTPPRINWYVRDSLAALRYKSICNQFGIFFLHLDNSEQPWVIEDILQADTPAILREIKVPTLKTRPKQMRRVEDENPELYPIGAEPTWQAITNSLLTNPTILIPKLPQELPTHLSSYENPDPETLEYKAGQLFIRFTGHIWLILGLTWRSEPQLAIKPKTIAEALQCWSIDFILQHITAPLFKPSNASSTHGLGRRTQGFSEQMHLYFPPPDDNLPGKWARFGDEPGYISHYHQTLHEMPESGHNTLNNCLSQLMEYCQCLPDSYRSEKVGTLWKTSQKRMIIKTNPWFYRIRTIGASGDTVKGTSQVPNPRAAPAHRNTQATHIALLEHEGFSNRIARAAIKQFKNQVKRSTKSKNYRKPPQRKIIPHHPPLLKESTNESSSDDKQKTSPDGDEDDLEDEENEEDEEQSDDRED